MEPTRLPCPWDSPGKNTGVGCHCLLQCIKVKSESEVAQSCPTLSDPMDCSLPGSSVHGIFQARVLEWGAGPKGVHSTQVLWAEACRWESITHMSRHRGEERLWFAEWRLREKKLSTWAWALCQMYLWSWWWRGHRNTLSRCALWPTLGFRGGLSGNRAEVGKINKQVTFDYFPLVSLFSQSFPCHLLPDFFLSQMAQGVKRSW